MGKKLVYDIVDTLPKNPNRSIPKRNLSKVKWLVVHCTAGSSQSPLSYAKYHISPNHISSRGCPTICYHDMIDKDGNLYRTARYDWYTMHVGSWNTSSIGISLMYNPSDPISGIDNGSSEPTEKALTTLVSQLSNLCLIMKFIPEQVIRGHREMQGTGWIWKGNNKSLLKTCPGLAINLDEIRKRTTKYLQLILKLEGLYKGRIDGIFGSKSIAALSAFNYRDSVILGDLSEKQ